MSQRQTMNVSLSPQHKAFVKEEVASGRFRNDSEVVREGLRLLAERNRQRRLEELLIEGLESGEPVELTDEVMADLRRRMEERIESVRQQQQVERLVMEAIERGETVEVSEQYLADLHRRVTERIDRVTGRGPATGGSAPPPRGQ